MGLTTSNFLGTGAFAGIKELDRTVVTGKVHSPDATMWTLIGTFIGALIGNYITLHTMFTCKDEHGAEIECSMRTRFPIARLLVPVIFGALVGFAVANVMKHIR
jgi:hypothetical protein